MAVADWSETYQSSVGPAGLSMVMGCLLDHGMRAVTKVYGEECGVRVWDLHKPWDDKSVKVSPCDERDLVSARDVVGCCALLPPLPSSLPSHPLFPPFSPPHLPLSS